MQQGELSRIRCENGDLVGGVALQDKVSGELDHKSSLKLVAVAAVVIIHLDNFKN